MVKEKGWGGMKTSFKDCFTTHGKKWGLQNVTIVYCATHPKRETDFLPNSVI